MFKIIIKKVPTARLFDPMPIPKKTRGMAITKGNLQRFAKHPFQRTVTRIN